MQKQFPFPSVDDWLTKCPESKRTQIMQLADSMPHDCFSCYWFTFAEGSANRGCHVPELKVDWENSVAPGLADCKSWRIDPDAKNRVRGIAGILR